MAALLEVQHISKHFGGLKATDNISMQVEQGEILGIIGPNGAGKTTFFNLITGTYRLTSGKIMFDGKDVTNYTPEKMAKLGIGRTFQNIKLFKFLSVLENVKVGFHIQTSTGITDSILHTKRYRNDEALANEKGMEILRRVGLADQAALLAGNLPYGWQRRLEIARAMALAPKILLLDEPAAGMNPSETAELMAFIHTLRDDGITVVVINYGKKLAEGTPAEVTRNEQVIEAYLGTGLTIDSRRAGGHTNE